MPTALITGVTGQDGTYLAGELYADNWDIHGLVRPGDPSAGETVPEAVTAHFIDLANSEGIGRLVTDLRPDVVFNLGGISSVAASWEHPVETAQVTGLAIVALLDAAWGLSKTSVPGIRLVQASSAEIFGVPVETPQNEMTLIAPASPYGAAKAFAHHMVQIYRRRGLFASNAILYNHESPRRPASFVTRKITQSVASIAAGNNSKLVLGNLDARRDWGWAPDYVDALRKIAGARNPDDFVIATGVSHSVREFVETAFEVAGINGWEEYVETDAGLFRPSDERASVGDASRARDVIGWKPTLSFKEVVTQMTRHDLARAGL